VESIGAATNSSFSLLPPENASGNFVKVVQRLPVKIVLDQQQDHEQPLRPGMSVIARVYTSE
jgi:membrane fusion protein (multidrug efflux system)